MLRPALARAEGDGVIRRSQTRGIPWDPVARDAAALFGTRVAETILASGHCRPRQKAGHMTANRRAHTLPKTLASRGPSTYGSLPSQGRRNVLGLNLARLLELCQNQEKPDDSR